jgi:capsule polysaccharide export protein KpsE/RkpR
MALPIGTGKRFLFVQTGLRDARASLDVGRPEAAAEQLARADAELRDLKTVWAGDPNLRALEAEIAALRKRIAPSG